MKRISIFMLFLGFVTLNTNLFAIKDNKEATNTEKAQLSKMDYAKIAAASLGFLWFSTAALTPPIMVRRYTLPHWVLRPVQSVAIPIYLASTLLGAQESNKNESTTITIAGTVSGIFASQLAIYLYKKISDLRKNEAEGPKADVSYENDETCEVLERIQQCKKY